jgi:hypothetical protein
LLFADGTRFRVKHAVKIASPHHALGKPKLSNMALTKFVKV